MPFEEVMQMKTIMRILLLSVFLYYLAGGLIGPLYAVFVQKIGGDLLTAGSAYAVFSIVSGVLIFLMSRWEDRVRHQEKMIVLGSGVAALGFLGYIFVSSPWELLVVQAIFGLEYAIGAPAFDSMYSKNLDKGRYATEWGEFESMRMAVLGISAVAGGVVAGVLGFRVLLVVMFALSVMSLVVSLLLLRNGKN
jgi:MFS family permease